MSSAMTGWPGQPVIYEVNTAIWLGELSRAAGRPLTLADVAPADWDAVTPAGVDAVWLMGVWERSPAGLVLTAANADLQASFAEALPDLRPADVIGSPYCVHRYVADALFGRPRRPAAPGLRAQPRRPRSPLGGGPARAVRARRRTRPRGRSSGLAGRGRARAGPWARPILSAVAGCGAARRVLASHARRDRPDAGRHRRSMRRAPLRHGHAADQRDIRQDVGKPCRTRASRGVLADGHSRAAHPAPGDRASRRNLLGHGMGAPAAGIQLLLRQTAL